MSTGVARDAQRPGSGQHTPATLRNNSEHDEGCRYWLDARCSGEPKCHFLADKDAHAGAWDEQLAQVAADHLATIRDNIALRKQLEATERQNKALRVMYSETTDDGDTEIDAMLKDYIAALAGEEDLAFCKDDAEGMDRQLEGNMALIREYGDRIEVLEKDRNWLLAFAQKQDLWDDEDDLIEFNRIAALAGEE